MISPSIYVAAERLGGMQRRGVELELEGHVQDARVRAAECEGIFEFAGTLTFYY